MGRPIHRLGDLNAAGAPVIACKAITVLACRKPVATNGDPVKGHGPGRHAFPKTANGSITVRAQKRPINRVGDSDTCGHPRAFTSCPTVLIGV